jgi:hypothetical protein
MQLVDTQNRRKRSAHDQPRIQRFGCVACCTTHEPSQSCADRKVSRGCRSSNAPRVFVRSFVGFVPVR